MLKLKIEGMARLRAELRTRARRWPGKVRRTLYRWGEGVMTESKDECPVDTGNLRSTGHVALAPEPAIRIELVYGGPAATYAPKVHETHRTQSKFLENPINRNVGKLIGALAREAPLE